MEEKHNRKANVMEQEKGREREIKRKREKKRIKG